MPSERNDKKWSWSKFRKINISNNVLKIMDFVFGVASMCEPHWQATDLYSEPLMYIPADKRFVNEKGAEQVSFKIISDETFVMVPDACGLAKTTRELFRRHRSKLKEYTGEALSYSVLAQWAELGVGSAILPKSKVSFNKQPTFLIEDRLKNIAEIRYQSYWLPSNIAAPELTELADHLINIAPAIVKGLHL